MQRQQKNQPQCTRNSPEHVLLLSVEGTRGEDPGFAGSLSAVQQVADGDQGVEKLLVTATPLSLRVRWLR